MTGRGKGVKGLGSGGTKHHRISRTDNTQGISRGSIRRLARCGGVKRMSALVYEGAPAVLKVFVANLVRDAIVYTQHTNRKTVTTMNVFYALKRQGRTLYGFGH
ncbi:trifunctional histidinol dehydrogenase [Phytophthora oleae]|uniref:Histone H4 n=1 Tax=Phytophthora oleae TaxID=2107226 RepID=A0ABD3FKZ9_9STRA